MPLLPPIEDEEAYGRVRGADIYRPAVAEIARRHRLAGEPRRYPGGSLPVFALGEELVVKLFPPPVRRNRDNERDALAFLAGRLSVATPDLVAADELDGWPYLVMRQLPGRRMDEVWPDLDRAGRLALADQLGAMIGELHALPTDGAELPIARVDWDRFIGERRARCAEHQAGRGADPAWVALVPDFLARVDLPAGAPVFLHTEVMPDHLLVDGGRLSGLVDFEPSMIGAREYEFASVGLFFAAGDRELLARAVAGAGLVIDPGLPERLCAYALVHRYSNLAWYLRRMPPREGVRDLEALSRQWFAL